MQFYFGPDKTPFILGQSDPMPFHGIVSRGLLKKLIENNIRNEVWCNNTHLLERDCLDSDSTSHDLLKLREFAAECKVLSFGQSTACAKRYLENYFNKLLHNDDGLCEIWNIKEGHTSSVWKVSYFGSSFHENHFILNVARDHEAGIELEITSEKMMRIAECYPDINMAKVYDIRKIPLIYNNKPCEVVVTRNEWINNSYEIHFRKNKQTGKYDFLMVDRFFTSENNPAYITSILGRIFTNEEVNIIRNEIKLFITKATACLAEKPKIDINDGDVVWDGEKAIVIAIA